MLEETRQTLGMFSSIAKLNPTTLGIPKTADVCENKKYWATMSIDNATHSVSSHHLIMERNYFFCFCI